MSLQNILSLRRLTFDPFDTSTHRFQFPRTIWLILIFYYLVLLSLFYCLYCLNCLWVNPRNKIWEKNIYLHEWFFSTCKWFANVFLFLSFFVLKRGFRDKIVKQKEDEHRKNCCLWYIHPFLLIQWLRIKKVLESG